MDGDTNCVADCLSWYYENDAPDDHHLDHDFMSADAKLDLDRELIPVQQHTKMYTATTRRSTHLARGMTNQTPPPPTEQDVNPTLTAHSSLTHIIQDL